MRSFAGGLLAAAASIALVAPAAGQEERRELALELVNEARRTEGLAPLTLEDNLVATAEAHAEDMLERDYYAHVTPEGETVRDRFLAQGGDEWRLVSENIAMCRGCPTPSGPERVREFQQGWMESPEHRANILDPGLEEFGFAMTSGQEVVYAVQTFAGPGQPEGVTPGEAEEEASPEALRERALDEVNRARQVEGLEPLSASAALDQAAARLTDAGAVQEAEGALSEAIGAVDGTWASVGMVSGECGGCGAVPTRPGAANFVGDWLEESSLRQTLLDPQAESFGFALTASGKGRVGAVALTGRP